MLRGALAVLAGAAVWAVLWVSSNTMLMAALPSAFDADGGTDSVPVLVLVLGMSAVYSVVAGYLTALVARQREVLHAGVLGILQLAIGIFVQLQFWNLMPLWYHMVFLVSLFPLHLLGGVLRARQKPQARMI